MSRIAARCLIFIVILGLLVSACSQKSITDKPIPANCSDFKQKVFQGGWNSSPNGQMQNFVKRHPEVFIILIEEKDIGIILTYCETRGPTNGATMLFDGEDPIDFLGPKIFLGIMIALAGWVAHKALSA